MSGYPIFECLPTPLINVSSSWLCLYKINNSESWILSVVFVIAYSEAEMIVFVNRRKLWRCFGFLPWNSKHFYQEKLILDSWILRSLTNRHAVNIWGSNDWQISSYSFQSINVHWTTFVFPRQRYSNCPLPFEIQPKASKLLWI